MGEQGWFTMETLETVILYLGCYVLLLWAYRFVSIVWRHFFGVSATVRRYGEDSYAVITGGTDAIGRASALYLARQGFNIVLIAKDIAKLKDVATEVRGVKSLTGKPIKTRIIVNNDYDAATFEGIYNQHLADLDISILHNNSSMAIMGPFLDMSEDDVHNMVTTNTYGAVLFTKQILKTMINRNKTRKMRSLIVFTSSMASAVPVPNGAIFSATKILNDFICWGLQGELSEHKIDVTSWRPASVKMPARSSLTEVNADDFVACGFSKVTSGVHCGNFASELTGMMISNMLDVLPIEVPMMLMGSKFAQFQDTKRKVL